VRLFAAIPLQEAVDSLAKVFEEFQPFDSYLKTVKENQFHLTLKFFGNLKSDDAQSVINAFDQWSPDKASFHIDLKGLGVFPSLSKPSVIWAGLKDDEGSILDIYKDCENIFSSIGIEKESRTFHPHLTLYRIKKHKEISQDLRDLVKEYKDQFFSTLQIQSIILYESKLHSYGPEYSEIKKIILK